MSAKEKKMLNVKYYYLKLQLGWGSKIGVNGPPHYNSVFGKWDWCWFGWQAFLLYLHRVYGRWEFTFSDIEFIEANGWAIGEKVRVADFEWFGLHPRA